MRLGSRYLGDRRCEFRVWAPQRQQVALRLLPPAARDVPLSRDERGYWHGILEGVEPGQHYVYWLDQDLERPDPASRCQPEGVHGPSQVVDCAQFAWTDGAWRGRSLRDYVIYELHVGTFTPAGTFGAILERLPELKALGITALELMPVCPFPGDRNWGYDGTYLYGVHSAYGGVEGLQHLVNACHEAGLAVILDVVYNHFGPEGNYLWAYGPYFTNQYRTPWGDAVNFDQAESNEVRHFFLQNALEWLELFHIDALRLDAVHAIYDFSAQPFLQQLGAAVAEFNQKANFPRYLMAESDLNDVRVLRSRDQGGFGHDSQWCDDFHHALHTLLTGESEGYYADFGNLEHLATALEQGYVYTGQYAPHRRRNHGNAPVGCTGENFIVCSQNHDQIGNRLLGDRLAALVDFERLKLAAATVILSPFIPLLFMGEEYGESAPFMYFVSHSDPDLVRGVREGRQQEFRAFGWDKEVPDPQSLEVFQQSTLNWQQAETKQGRALRSLYRQLIQLRQQQPALANLDRDAVQVQSWPSQSALLVVRSGGEPPLWLALNFGEAPAQGAPELPPGSQWAKCLDTADTQWLGPGSRSPDRVTAGAAIALSPLSATLYERL